MSAKCQKCGTTWDGTAAAHCATCHETFSTVGNFDQHRARKTSGGKGEKRVILRDFGQCYDPRDDGMVRNKRGHWSVPNDGAFDFKSLADPA